MASPPSSPSSPPSSPPSPPPPPTPLPMDLQFEILSYLPCRSVVRFLVLSHAHFSYINSRDFITEHHERSPKYVLLLPSLDASLHNDDASLSLSTELRFPFLERANNEILCIIGECDGILCIETYRGIFFVNPAILRFFLVGPTQPQNNPHVHCYGFIRKGFDYILLHIEVDKQHHRRRGGPQSPRAWVYSFQQRSWRHVETPICTLCLSMCYPRSAVAYEGFLHWGAKRWVESSWHYFILTFCPHNEICGELLLPDRLAVPSTNDNKGVFLVGSGSNKPLTAYSLNYAETHHFTSVWTMDRYGDRESWTPLFTINLTPNYISSTLFHYNPTINIRITELPFLLFHRDNGELLMQVDYNEESSLRSFDVDNRLFSMALIGIYRDAAIVYAGYYKPSLVFLDRPRV